MEWETVSKTRPTPPSGAKCSSCGYSHSSTWHAVSRKSESIGGSSSKTHFMHLLSGCGTDSDGVQSLRHQLQKVQRDVSAQLQYLAWRQKEGAVLHRRRRHLQALPRKVSLGRAWNQVLRVSTHLTLLIQAKSSLWSEPTLESEFTFTSRLSFKVVKMKRTLGDLKRKYEEAMGKGLNSEELIAECKRRNKQVPENDEKLEKFAARHLHVK